MPGTYRTAIAGIGAVAELHAQAIADLDNATLIAGSSRTESSGREFADRHGCTWYADTAIMLDDATPDVLIVCTPNATHLEPTLVAAKQGVDVLCEKPLEVTTERIDRMCDAAESAGIALVVVFQQRFTDIFQTVYDAAAAGRFGRLSVANAYVPRWRADESGDTRHRCDAVAGGRDDGRHQ